MKTNQNNIKNDIEEILRLHEVITENDKTSLELAIAAGEILLKMKSKRDFIPHGQWKKWVETNLPTMDLRTVQRYMELAKNDSLSFLEKCNSLNEAYELLKSTKEKNKPKSPKVKFNHTMEQEVLNRVMSEIREVKMNWNHSEWEVQEGQPASRNNENCSRLGMVVAKMQSLILNRQYTNVEFEEETIEKLKIIIRSIFASSISGNTPEPIIETNRVVGSRIDTAHPVTSVETVTVE
jgi:hypothetical protein